MLKKTEDIQVNKDSVFYSRLGCMALVAILVDRLGGKVEVTQEDYDKVAHMLLQEDNDELKTVLTLKRN